MTVYQQAHGLIDMLSEESAEVVVQVMLRMLPYERRPVQGSEPAGQIPVQSQAQVQAQRPDQMQNLTQEEQQIQELLQKQGLYRQIYEIQNPEAEA